MGLVALQTLSTSGKDTDSLILQSNELFLKFPRQQTVNSKFRSDLFLKKKTYGVGIHPRLTLNFKKSATTSDYQSNEPPPRFIRSPFLLIPYIPKVTTYNTYSKGFRGVVIHKVTISEPFNYVEQNGYIKIFIRCVWGNGERGRGVSSPPKTFDWYNRHMFFQFLVKWAVFEVSSTTNCHLKISVRCISWKHEACVCVLFGEGDPPSDHSESQKGY